jgi:hypothetical protein
MTRNKNLLAAAICGLLVSGNAAASPGAVLLGVDAPRTYASEMTAPVDLSADANDNIRVALGYNFSPSEVRYGRVECQGAGELSIDNASISESDGNVDLGSINGAGTGGLFFSLTADPALATSTDSDMLYVEGDLTLGGDGDVDCAFSIYDQPSQAQAGGVDGRIYTTGFQPFIRRASGFTFTSSPAPRPVDAVADVENGNGPYFGFDGTDYFANLQFEQVDGVLNAYGSQVQLLDIFGSDMTVTVDGDFSALDTLWVWNYANSSWYIPDSQDAETATFISANFGTDFDVDFSFSETGEAAIPVSDYTATLHADTNPGYEVADIGPIQIGHISHNGTELQAPLANVPTGWISRMVLTNTGGTDRPYQIGVMGETGNTIGTANLTGVVPANGTKVVDLDTVMKSFSGKARGTVNVSVAAPNNQIQGLLQIVSDSGAISNETMVRPASN